MKEQVKELKKCSKKGCNYYVPSVCYVGRKTASACETHWKDIAKKLAKDTQYEQFIH